MNISAFIQTSRKPGIRWMVPALLVCLWTFQAAGAQWAHWRGPNFDGSTDEKGLPANFSKTENVLWVTPLPGPSAATPVVWDNHVFVSSVDENRKTLLAMAIHRKTGNVIWSHQVGVGISHDERSNYASPSPVTDGSLVYFFYGNGELVAFDFAGNKVWGRNIQKDYGNFAFQWTFSTSPTLYDNKLYMQVLQRDTPVNGRGNRNGPNESYILALHPKTGKELWKVLRPSEAKDESLEAFTTPVPYHHEGQTQLLVAGGDCLTGHDIKTGKEIWRWGTWNPERVGHWRLVPSPVAGEGIVLGCTPKGGPVYAVALGAEGTLPDNGYAWKSGGRTVSTDVSTPLFYKGYFYVLNSDRRTISKVVPKTGHVVWTGEMESRDKIESSPTASDDRIYFMDFRGKVSVVGTGDEFEILHEAQMGDDGDNHLRSSVVMAHGTLLIRTGNKLYGIGASH